MSAEDVEYRLKPNQFPNQPDVVRGFQVGLIAVRDMEPILYKGGYIGRFSVDHIPSGRSLVSTNTFTAAMTVADDLSRFSPGDLENAKSDAEIMAALGPLSGWVEFLCARGVGPMIDFREWQRSQEVTEVRPSAAAAGAP